MAPATSSAPTHPSPSTWSWSSEYGLYFDPNTSRWAKPLPNGTWEYADAVKTAPAAAEREEERGGRRVVSYADIEDDPPVEEDRDAASTIPEEQLWPADDSPPPPDPYARAPLLRLVVRTRPDAAVLPSAQCVAQLEPSEPTSIGRDKSFERRVRLRELAVSKSHCTVFWSIDPELENGGFWAITDNGSTHGTFLRGDGETKELRLSEPKVASLPQRLHHLDLLRVGSTTFTLHQHASFACSLCSVASDSSNLIPLVPSSSSAAEEKPAGPAYTTKTKGEKEQDRREQLKGLKERFLKPDSGGKGKPSARAAPPSAPASASSSPAFIDRAAARRHRDAAPPAPSSRKPQPKAAPALNPFFAVPGPAASFSAPPSRTTAAPKPPDPFAEGSKGAAMLAKLSGPGVAPSSSSSSTSSAATPGLGTLIQPRTLASSSSSSGEGARAGLGSRPLIAIERVAADQSTGEKRDWREDVREKSRKRFRELG
ncbi:hypothetical protein JCM10207_006426 [Rhodosporidiobolus poonsookiae]